MSSRNRSRVLTAAASCICIRSSVRIWFSASAAHQGSGTRRRRRRPASEGPDGAGISRARCSLPILSAQRAPARAGQGRSPMPPERSPAGERAPARSAARAFGIARSRSTSISPGRRAPRRASVRPGRAPRPARPGGAPLAQARPRRPTSASSRMRSACGLDRRAGERGVGLGQQPSSGSEEDRFDPPRRATPLPGVTGDQDRRDTGHEGAAAPGRNGR